MSDEFLDEIKEMLKEAIRDRDWTEICEVIERINEELDVVDEEIEYVSPREPSDEDQLSETE